MRNPSEATSTPWQFGRFDGSPGKSRLMFRRMFEDWSVELAAFRNRRRVACIASGGCTAITLANHGHEVTAIDINAAQIEHVKARLAGNRESDSDSERVLRVRRMLLRCLGVSRRTIDDFLSCSEADRQLELWNRIWSRRTAVAARIAFHPAVLRMVYATRFVGMLPKRFDQVLARRLRRGLAIHPNRDNPFAWQMFDGMRPAHLDPMISPTATIALVHADIVEFLNRQRPASFDAFSLSNILDGCTAPYRDVVVRAVRRAAAPGAVVILRTFGNPASTEPNWRELDRSHLWGSVTVERVKAGAATCGGSFGVAVHPLDLEIGHVHAA